MSSRTQELCCGRRPVIRQVPGQHRFNADQSSAPLTVDLHCGITITVTARSDLPSRGDSCFDPSVVFAGCMVITDLLTSSEKICFLFGYRGLILSSYAAKGIFLCSSFKILLVRK